MGEEGTEDRPEGVEGEEEEDTPLEKPPCNIHLWLHAQNSGYSPR